jgi:uncharacterized lipoprotein YmbA
MKIQKNSCLFLLLAVHVALLTGCLGLKPTTDPTKFYVLTSVAEKGKHKPSGTLSVRLARVDLASYVENPAIAMRRGENQIDYLQYYNWAEPIRSGIERTLQENLSRNLGIAVGRNLIAPSTGGRSLEVRVNISRFELTDKNQAIVAANWIILNVQDRNVVDKGQLEVKKKFSYAANDAGPGVAALSSALAEVSHQISQGIQKVP